MKRRRSLLRRVILLTALALTVAEWLPLTNPQAQQNPQAQRPRRVNGSEQDPKTYCWYSAEHHYDCQRNNPGVKQLPANQSWSWLHNDINKCTRQNLNRDRAQRQP